MPQETLNIILFLAGFGILHSLTAAIGVKSFIRKIIGERATLGLYRFVYNVVSGVTFAPVMWLLVAQPGKTIWSVQGAGGDFLTVLQAVGVVGLGTSLFQIDAMRFLGIRQASAYLSFDPLPLPPEPLATGGVYRLVRHPLYFFSMLFLWANPEMSAAALGLAIGASVYFTLGSLLEERKLEAEFGEEYQRYRSKVAWMIPFVL